MPVEWLAILCAVAGSAVGAFVGVKVAVAALGARVTVLEKEVALLREAKHSHAQFLTRHEADLSHMKYRLGEPE